MDARHHAEQASALLSGIDAMSERLDRMDDDERLRAAIAGGFARVNQDLRWTCELAIAHALTALALGSLEPDDDELET